MSNKTDIPGNIESLEKFMREHEVAPSGVSKKVKQMLTFGPKCNAIANSHGEFGYDKSNPIPVRLPDGEAEYLQSLRCECGEKFGFSRIGSFGPGPDGHVVDGFDLVCESGNHRIKLFLDMYHAGPSTFVPKGLKQADA